LAAFEDATARGCRVVAITSGGEMTLRASTAEVPVVPVPGGLQPRAAFGHLAMAALGVLEAMELVPGLDDELDDSVAVLEAQAAALAPGVERNPAKILAERIEGRTPVIWGAEGFPAVAAMRWKTQLNENAKVPAWWSAMSELDHNEIAAWMDGSGRDHVIVALRDEHEAPGIAPRFPLSAAIASDAGADVVEVPSRGRTDLARFLSLVHTGDLVSVYLALLRGVDPTPVDAIVRLKRALG
jgi:glucose/mannose-6-phosphate isomerase